MGAFEDVYEDIGFSDLDDQISSKKSVPALLNRARQRHQKT